MTRNGFDPEHHFYDWDGNKITVEQWAEMKKSGSVLEKDGIRLPTLQDADLITVWLGFVEPAIPGARLFGTAIVVGRDFQQIEVYDSQEQALAGHKAHLKASRAGFHCQRCRRQLDHIG